MAKTVADIPALLVLWHEEKNEEPAAKVPARAYRTCWWRCRAGHEFQRKPRMLSKEPVCPICELGGSSLADTHPGLVKRWHPGKNLAKPTDVTASHTANVWWVCADGHAFQRSPLQMTNDGGCPHCALSAESLAANFPELAAEWHPHKNGDLAPEQVEPDHRMTAWWLCSKGHEFQAVVRSRTRSHGRCPRCYGAWTVDSIRTFVRSLLGHIDVLTPSEMFALAMQAGALRGRASAAFVKALTTGRFPVGELEKFADGKPSLVDDFAEDEELTLERVEGRVDAVAQQLERSKDDRYALPDAPDSEYLEEEGELDVPAAVTATSTVHDGERELPVVQTRDALAALDTVFVANADAETVRFLLQSAQAKLWRHAYMKPAEAEKQAREFKGDAYSTIVRDRFLAQYDAAMSMKLPEGYSFRPTPAAAIAEPNLMQRHVAVSVAEGRRFGNWSGMGAGKTLSAIVATRLTRSGLTIICCPNAVVDNWEKEINNAFPGLHIQKKTWTPQWPDAMSNKPHYLILNYEQFQLKTSEERLVDFLARHVVDFIVIDEIHFAKQRSEKAMSRRKRLVQGLILESGKKNPELCVLGMSGTPVINTLQEGRSLIELITGHRHDEIETKATVQNCMRLYQRFVTLGTRWKPNYATQLETLKPEVDCVEHLQELREVGRGTVLEMERVLTTIRVPTIIEHCERGKKTLLYTHYVDGISSQLREAVIRAGLRPGLYTGKSDDSDLEEFKRPNGQVDVLIASSRVSTGVDGLQHVCDTLIINSLPWTNAEYEQLRARLWRQGSAFEKVTVVIPVTFAYVNGERWSYCESKLHRLEYKKSIADAAVDGVVPEGNLRTPAQAQQDIMGWLERLESGAVETIERRLIKVPLSREPSEIKRRTQRYGDFSRMNNRWYAASSQRTHTRLEANPEEWAHYHTMYRSLRERWEVIPFKEEIRWLEQREGYVVADLGCGEAMIAEAVGERHEVLSFDHVAINDSVQACDISAVPVDDGVLDVAIFCLSLMGANFTEYLREAHRCLRVDGELHVWEPANKFDDVEQFCVDLGHLGFDVLPPRKEGLFMRIRALKNVSAPIPDRDLRFRNSASDR